MYLAIRRLEVAEGHLRIGFREVDRLVVRLKPLRPLSLIGKHFGAPRLVLRSAKLVDRVAGLPLRLSTRRPRLLSGPVEPLRWPADAEPLAELLSAARSAASPGVGRCPSAESPGSSRPPTTSPTPCSGSGARAR